MLGDATPYSLAWTTILNPGGRYAVLAFWDSASRPPGEREVREKLETLGIEAAILPNLDVDFSPMFGRPVDHMLVNIEPSRIVVVWQIIEIFEQYGAIYAMVSDAPDLIVPELTKTGLVIGQKGSDNIEDVGKIALPSIATVLAIAGVVVGIYFLSRVSS